MIQYLTLIIFLHDRKKKMNPKFNIYMVVEPVWSEMGQTQKLNNRHNTNSIYVIILNNK